MSIRLRQKNKYFFLLLKEEQREVCCLEREEPYSFFFFYLTSQRFVRSFCDVVKFLYGPIFFFLSEACENKEKKEK